ncbi:hypothetical protein [Thermoleophilum album]|uniref:Uncharacterized protein n=1 Tax=Thermoleophilum album TaxID=29539 RepID=A0A1H6FRI3_THEAL|nr:hypothetical protein [Thermoleophilum album]SEH12820.1 hypothetical protein SAMN02745716_1214 [Thermoleophilum album]
MTRLLVQRSEASSAAWPIVNSSMNPVAVATPPQAHDANGKPVPVTASVNGNTLTLHVPHTTGNYAYPIVVDPFWGWLKRRVKGCAKSAAANAISTAIQGARDPRVLGLAAGAGCVVGAIFD